MVHVSSPWCWLPRFTQRGGARDALQFGRINHTRALQFGYLVPSTELRNQGLRSARDWLGDNYCAGRGQRSVLCSPVPGRSSASCARSSVLVPPSTLLHRWPPKRWRARGFTGRALNHMCLAKAARSLAELLQPRSCSPLQMLQRQALCFRSKNKTTKELMLLPGYPEMSGATWPR